MAESIYFFDLSKTGKDPYGNKDAGVVTNAQAVLESVYNILLTEPGQHPMDPEMGTPLSKYLFEPIDYVTASMIEEVVRFSVEKFERRISNIVVNVIPFEEEQDYTINIYFNVNLISEEQQLTVSFSKIR
jgi:phage baseplate assembly protein W